MLFYFSVLEVGVEIAPHPLFLPALDAQLHYPPYSEQHDSGIQAGDQGRGGEFYCWVDQSLEGGGGVWKVEGVVYALRDQHQQGKSLSEGTSLYDQFVYLLLEHPQSTTLEQSFPIEQKAILNAH